MIPSHLFGQNTWGPLSRQDSFIPDQLIAGPLQVVTDIATIARGAVLVRGSVLGLMESSGQYRLSTRTAEDGSQNPSAILVDNVDTRDGEVRAGVYLMGEFNSHFITADISWSAPTLRSEMRKYSLFLKDAVSGALAAELSSS